MHSKQYVLDFMASNPHMVVSTLSKERKPQSAVVGFGQNDNFQIVFGTSRRSRKALNIAHNNAVSVVIGWDPAKGTVQLEGTARMLKPDEIESFAQVYFIKNPNARVYRNDPDERYFLITPSWLRFTDTGSYPWNVTELVF